MKYTDITRHAQNRMQQRAISELAIQLITLFGDDHYQKGGATLTYIPEKKARQLRSAIDRIAQLALIKGDQDKIVTVIHKHRKIHTTEYLS